MNAVTKALVAIALALAVAGALAGFALPVHDSSGLNCGSAFHESGSTLADRFADSMTGGSGDSDCTAWRNQALQLPVALLVIGVGCGAAALWISRQQPESPHNAPPAP